MAARFARVADEIVHRPTGGRVEREEAVVGVPYQNTLAFEGAADALGQPLHQPLQLRFARRGDLV